VFILYVCGEATTAQKCHSRVYAKFYFSLKVWTQYGLPVLTTKPTATLPKVQAGIRGPNTDLKIQL